ncbi:MAG: hypothetical protein H7832_03445 [Magnetococcus sp. DMHC-6]
MESVEINAENNPLFSYYGRIVARCFPKGVQPNAPMDLFPVTVRYNGSDGATPVFYNKQLSDFADSTDLEFIQSSIRSLRYALRKEENDLSTDAQLQGRRLTTQLLKEFHQALKREKEAMLDDNPFYELTGLIWRLNTGALNKAFIAAQASALENAPRPIKVARSFAQIWKTNRQVTDLKQKTAEIVGKITAIGKLTLGSLLFIGSSLTTAKGVNDLVQHPSFSQTFGQGLIGSDNESLRLFLAIFFGLALSSVILDFKSRLFQGVAESGLIFKGYWNAFKQTPRWFVLAMFLTAISIWTNYDGIVLLMSKTEDLTWQWKKIQLQVKMAIGEQSRQNSEQPESLWDLQAVLNNRVIQALEKFNVVPDDEMSGIASSGIARKGPRYWGKYFIIHGGYRPGQENVALKLNQSGQPFGLTDEIDAMLLRSPLDLRLSLEAHMQKIVADYAQDLTKTQFLVQQQMNALESMMGITSLSLQNLYLLFSLESYHINKQIQDIVAILEQNKKKFQETAQQLNQLTASYIDLLSKVDKAGGITNHQYNIHVEVHIPALEAIDRLREGGIPMAKRRNLEELKGILLERYGLAVGGLILFFILFVAISMDLSDPIFYSAMVARWGRKDRHFLDENIQQFRTWENELIQKMRLFLTGPDIRPVLPHLSCPPVALLYWNYHQFLEELHPALKNYVRLNTQEKFRFWFLGLFQSTRIQHVKAYNARQIVTTKFLLEAETLAPKFLNQVYGGVFSPFKIGIDHFDLLFTHAHGEMKRHERALNQQIAMLDSKSQVQSIYKPIHWLYTLFLKPFAPPTPPFPLKRDQWLLELVQLQVRTQTKIGSLFEFNPLLTKLLNQSLPDIKNNFLSPLLNTLKEIPNSKELAQALHVNSLQEECLYFEEELLCLFGISQNNGFPINESIFNEILNNSKFLEMKGDFFNLEENRQIIENKIQKLENRLVRAYAITQHLVAERDLIFSQLASIRKIHLRPINSFLAPLQNREVIEKAIGLYELTQQFYAIEKFMMDLWYIDSEKIDAMDSNLAIMERNSVAYTQFLLFFNPDYEHLEVSLLKQTEALNIALDQIRKKIDLKLFSLTFIDKSIKKTNDLLAESLKLISNLLVIEAELNAVKVDETKRSLSKIHFFEDNLVFLRSVPSLLASLQEDLHGLIHHQNIMEKEHLEAIRILENQIFKLHYFLKHASEFIEGKRSGAGLSVPVLQLKA